jgi:hypothetical protein
MGLNKKMEVSYDDVHRLVSDMVIEINNRFNPEAIVAIEGGGLLPGLLFRKKLNIPLFTVSIKSYLDKERRDPEIHQWFDALAYEDIWGKRILIVDDLNDSGSTLEFCIQNLEESCQPSKIGVAVLHHKMKDKEREIPTNVEYFYGQEVEDLWITYPWEKIYPCLPPSPPNEESSDVEDSSSEEEPDIYSRDKFSCTVC